VEQAAIYNTRVKDGRRTMLRASIGVLVAVTVVYVLASWSYQVFWGDKVAAETTDPNAAFALAGIGVLGTLVHIQLLVSIFAALLSFHNATVQYLYSMGVLRVLWSRWSQVNRFDAPWVASLTLTIVSLAAIAAVRLAKLDPLTWMFYRGGNFGGFLVFGLLTATSVAVLVRFRRNPEGEPAATRLVAPLVAAVGLGVMVYFVATNYASLINVDPHSREAWAWPWSNAAIALLGLLRGLYMKKYRRTDYAALPHYQPKQPPTAPAPRASQPQTVGGW